MKQYEERLLIYPPSHMLYMLFLHSTTEYSNEITIEKSKRISSGNIYHPKKKMLLNVMLHVLSTFL